MKNGSTVALPPICAYDRRDLEARRVELEVELATWRSKSDIEDDLENVLYLLGEG